MISISLFFNIILQPIKSHDTKNVQYTAILIKHIKITKVLIIIPFFGSDIPEGGCNIDISERKRQYLYWYDDIPLYDTEKAHPGAFSVCQRKTEDQISRL